MAPINVWAGADVFLNESTLSLEIFENVSVTVRPIVDEFVEEHSDPFVSEDMSLEECLEAARQVVVAAAARRGWSITITATEYDEGWDQVRFEGTGEGELITVHPSDRLGGPYGPNTRLVRYIARWCNTPAGYVTVLAARKAWNPETKTAAYEAMDRVGRARERATLAEEHEPGPVRDALQALVVEDGLDDAAWDDLGGWLPIDVFEDVPRKFILQAPLPVLKQLVAKRLFADERMEETCAALERTFDDLDRHRS